MPAWLFGLTFSIFMRCIASGSILGLVCSYRLDSIAGVLRVALWYRLYVPVCFMYVPVLLVLALWYRLYRYGLRLPAGFVTGCTYRCMGFDCPLALLPVNVPVYGLRLPAGLAIVDLWASYHVGK